MANRRKLKKNINYLCGDLFAECIAVRQFNNVNADDVDNVMRSILLMQDDLICRTSHVEPGMKSSVFFKKLRDDMQARTSDIIEQLTNLI